MKPNTGTVYKRAGSPYWWLSFHANGRRYNRSSKVPVGPRNAGRAEARDMLDALRGNSKRGVSPDVDKVSLADLERLVVANLAANGKVSGDRATAAYKHLKEHLAAMPALAIPPLLDEYIVERQGTVTASDGTITKRGASAATVRQELRWLSRGYSLACQKGLLPSRPALPAITVSNARQGFVTEEQLEKIVAALPEFLRAPTRFAFLTGWRRGEILSLKWASIDLENGVARVEASNSKTRRAREFPFGAMPELAVLVKAQREATSALERSGQRLIPWVFHRNGNPIARIQEDWRNAAEAAGLDVVFHDLRRSAIRQMELASVPRSTAMRLSGHLTESTFTRYAISSQADLSAGVAKIAALRASRAVKTG